MVANTKIINNFYYYFGFLGFYFSVRFFCVPKNIQSNQMSSYKFAMQS